MEQAKGTIDPAQSPENTVPPTGTGYPATGMGFEATTPEQYSARIARTLNRNGTGAEQPGPQINWGHIDVDPRAVTFDWEKYRASLAQAQEQAQTDQADSNTDELTRSLDQLLNNAAATDSESDKQSSEAEAEHDGDSDTGKRTYRTAAKAREAGAITEMRKELAIPTASKYKDALTPLPSRNAHLQPIIKALASQITYRDGTLQFNGRRVTGKQALRLHDNTLEASASIDLLLIWGMYSLIFYSLQDKYKTIEEVDEAISDPSFYRYSVAFYAPDFLRMMGLESNFNQEIIEKTVKKIISYGNLAGIIPTRSGHSYYPALSLVRYDSELNVIEFFSPYFNYIIMQSRRDSVIKDRRNRPKLKSNGEPFTRAVTSHLVNANIGQIGSEMSTEIIRAVVTMIERTGYHGPDDPPKISAQKIIEQCPKLAYSLSRQEKAKDKNIILKRAFSRAWAKLDEYTTLKDAYEDIQFPDPKMVPTSSKLNETVFKFPHKGKRKKSKANSTETQA